MKPPAVLPCRPVAPQPTELFRGDGRDPWIRRSRLSSGRDRVAGPSPGLPAEVTGARDGLPSQPPLWGNAYFHSLRLLTKRLTRYYPLVEQGRTLVSGFR